MERNGHSKGKDGTGLRSVPSPLVNEADLDRRPRCALSRNQASTKEGNESRQNEPKSSKQQRWIALFTFVCETA